jgi:hypothetical protein
MIYLGDVGAVLRDGESMGHGTYSGIDNKQDS